MFDVIIFQLCEITNMTRVLISNLTDTDSCDACEESMEGLHEVAESIITPGKISHSCTSTNKKQFLKKLYVLLQIRNIVMHARLTFYVL